MQKLLLLLLFAITAVRVQAQSTASTELDSLMNMIYPVKATVKAKLLQRTVLPEEDKFPWCGTEPKERSQPRFRIISSSDPSLEGKVIRIQMDGGDAKELGGRVLRKGKVLQMKVRGVVELSPAEGDLYLFNGLAE